MLYVLNAHGENYISSFHNITTDLDIVLINDIDDVKDCNLIPQNVGSIQKLEEKHFFKCINENEQLGFLLYNLQEIISFSGLISRNIWR